MERRKLIDVFFRIPLLIAERQHGKGTKRRAQIGETSILLSVVENRMGTEHGEIKGDHSGEPSKKQNLLCEGSAHPLGLGGALRTTL